MNVFPDFLGEFETDVIVELHCLKFAMQCKAAIEYHNGVSYVGAY